MKGVCLPKFQSADVTVPENREDQSLAHRNLPSTTANTVGKTGHKDHQKSMTNLGGRTGKFFDPVRSLLKSKNQEINRLQLVVKLPWAIFFESVDILS
ncbi:hypothetical protein TNCV_1525371 [Trichonephila clavipes]|nr:hypothetical protein TNCV_1525371 [Trichonephila clavipes]